mmetsp:Transcript_36098/g.86048  ORF Transcript_36098/g.86048 Transcript_36098/m.86048 type:complete len:236 (-) Transcript_36098:74-781(-)
MTNQKRNSSRVHGPGGPEPDRPRLLRRLLGTRDDPVRDDDRPASLVHHGPVEALPPPPVRPPSLPQGGALHPPLPVVHRGPAGEGAEAPRRRPGTSERGPPRVLLQEDRLRRPRELPDRRADTAVRGLEAGPAERRRGRGAGRAAAARGRRARRPPADPRRRRRGGPARDDRRGPRRGHRELRRVLPANAHRDRGLREEAGRGRPPPHHGGGAERGYVPGVHVRRRGGGVVVEGR